MLHAFRLTFGQDLLHEIERYAAEHHLKSAVPLSAVGCLTHWRLRDAGGVAIEQGEEPVEILSLNGTVSENGCHLHLGLARAAGLAAFGGHLVSGAKVNTTAEIVLLELPGFLFTRAPDGNTGYDELVIRAVTDAKGL